MSKKRYEDNGKGPVITPVLDAVDPGIETVFLAGIEEDEPETGWQSHVHEFTGSTRLAGGVADSHNHRFAGMSGEAIYVPGSHVHRIETATDYYGHYHRLRAITGPAVFVLRAGARPDGNDGKHIHYIEGLTSQVNGHWHACEAGTLVEAPLAGGD